MHKVVGSATAEYKFKLDEFGWWTEIQTPEGFVGSYWYCVDGQVDKMSVYADILADPNCYYIDNYYDKAGRLSSMTSGR